MKQIKEAIPLDHITGVSMSPGKDSWVVVKMKAPVRDLVLDLGIHGVERHSEFVTVLHARVKELLKQELKVTFEETIAYNNSRKPGSRVVRRGRRGRHDSEIRQEPQTTQRWPLRL